MTEALVVFGAVVGAIGLFAIVFPARLLEAGTRIPITTPLRLAAFVLRVLFGIVALWVAPSTRSPVAVGLIGVVLIVSGVAVLLVSDAQLQSWRDAVLRRGPGVVRAGGAASVLFAVFLVYAAW